MSTDYEKKLFNLNDKYSSIEREISTCTDSRKLIILNDHLLQIQESLDEIAQDAQDEAWTQWYEGGGCYASQIG